MVSHVTKKEFLRLAALRNLERKDLARHLPLSQRIWGRKLLKPLEGRIK